MNAILDRQHFQISRDSEYFSRNELQAQTGQPAEAFFHVLLKELVDNALDAAETAGKPPEVGIEVCYGEDELHLAVTDNGNGISASVVEKILDFRTRTSDKAAYRAPTRGAQGNALKTIVGIPVSLGADQSSMVIEAQGIRHLIAAWLDPAGAVRIKHQIEDTETAGTRVTVTVPSHQWLRINPKPWVFGYAVLNPHVAVKIRQFEISSNQAKSLLEENSDFYHCPTNIAWRRFLPSDPTVPHWYDADSFARLVQLSIHQNDMPLRAFVRQFRGLTGTAKAKAVCTLVEADRLKDLDGNRAAIDRLHKAMIQEAVELKPEALGIIGQDHWQKRIDQQCQICPNRFWYKRIKGAAGSVPFIVEAALAETKDPIVVIGVNFSPSYGDPLANIRLPTPEFSVQGVNSFLLRCEATMDHRFTIVLHIVCPALRFLDRGKTRLDADNELAEACAEALWSVCKTAYKEMKARLRDAAKADRQVEQYWRDNRLPKLSQKELVFECLPEAVEIATGNGQYPVSARNLYYKVRALLSDKTDKDLDYNYFSQGLLTEYQADYGRIEALYYDPRGWLYEPHSGREIQLGTQEVEQYEFPSWKYDKLLYVEKKGLWPILKQAQIAERYDMAVICAEGFATTAARTLFANAQQQRQYQLFVLHDCDPDGYNIARTLAEATKRMPNHQIDIIDLGLKLETARELELLVETYTRKKALPQGLELTEAELAFFILRKSGKHYIAQRYELNALTAPQFIALVEDGLREHGANRKLIPPDNVIANHAKAKYAEDLEYLVRYEIEKALDVEKLVDKAMHSLPRLIRLDRARRWVGYELEPRQSDMEDHPKLKTISWDRSLDNAISRLLRNHRNRIYRAARDALKRSKP